MPGFPIRTSPDQSLMTAPRGLSQPSTSFFGNIRLGIHCVPLSTFLCIDLTSNCYRAKTKPSIYKNSNFFCKLLTSLHCHTLRAHFSSTRIVVDYLFALKTLPESSFLIVPLRLATCKVVNVIVCTRCRYVVRSVFTPPEVP